MAGGATTRSRRAGVRRSALAALATAALLLGAPAAAIAQTQDGRGVDRACDEGAQSAQPFADVEATTPEAAAINCLWVHGVVQGRFAEGEVLYDPEQAVDRQQLASFLANAMRVLPRSSYTPPDVTEPDFPDTDLISDVHRVPVARLQIDGIVAGYGDGTFRPGATVTRGQMASFVAAALEAVVGEELPRQAAFDDATGAHAASIEKLIAVGIVDTDAPRYAPDAVATRGQMAAFVAAGLDYLAERGHLVAIAYAAHSPDAARGLTDVTAASEAVADRLVFEVAAGEGTVGWQARYVDEAIEHGRGRTVPVRGEAILEVYLTGMAFPPELGTAVWEGGSLALDGPGIVEVVDVGVYEGRQLLFVGTTGRHAFEASRGGNDHSLHLDVTPG